MRSSELLRTVGDYVKLQRGSTYKGDLVGKPGPPLLGLGSIEPGGGFRSGHFKTFGGECPEKWMVQPGSLYVAFKGATKDGSMVGSVARLPFDLPAGRLTQDTARLDFLDPRPEIAQYLYWLLRTHQYRAYCAGRVTGSASASFSREDFLSFPVPPPIEGASAIVQTLESAEAKIEQNRRTSRALERLARAIFRAWFEEFEPVRAKAAGERSFPGMPPAVFDALPARLVDSDLGPIPEGWKVGRLGDHCKINASTVRKGEVEGEIEYVDISSVSVGRLDAVQRLQFGDAPSRARRRVRHGDTIWSCVRPNHRSYLFIHSPPDNRIVSTGFAVLSPTGFGPSYLHQMTTQPEFVDYLVSNADGSAYPAVRPEHFAAAEILVPPRTMLDAFETITMPFRDLIESADRESRRLAAVRDYLLPKLLSGEVRVAADTGAKRT